MFLAGLHVAHDDARQRVLALHADEPVLQDEIADEEYAGAMRNDIGPIVRRRTIDGCRDDLVVLGAIDIGLDDELAVPVLEFVFDARNPGRDKLWRIRWSLRIDDPDFRGIVIVNIDENVFFRIGLADAGEHAGVFFLIDQNVLRLRRAEHMPEGFQRPVALILQRVEIALAIGGPGGASARVLQDIGRILSGRRIAHPELIELRAIAIEGPGGEPVIGRHGDAAKAEVFAVLAQSVAVEQQFLRSLGATGFPQIARMLAAFHKGREIIIGTIGCGHRGIVFLQAALHFGKELVLQACRIGHHRLVIGVLALQKIADVLRQQGWVMHDLLPVAGLQPIIVVTLFVTVKCFDAPPLFGPRWLLRICFHGFRSCPV